MPPKKAPVPEVTSEPSPEPTPQPSPQLPSRSLEPVFAAPSASRSYARSAEPKGKSPAFDQEEVPTLAEAITLMTAELKSRDSKKPKIKAKEPDTFDGSDPKKLNNFILLCSLYFRQNSTYDYDEAKVTFALSYLRGTALEFFEPSLLSMENTPDWLDDWSIFIQTLRTQFGPIDPTADAEDSLDDDHPPCQTAPDPR